MTIRLLALAILYTSSRIAVAEPTFVNLSPIETGTLSQTFALGDVNGDGRLDLVVPTNTVGGPSVTVWLGDGIGGFAYKSAMGTQSSNYSAAFGDLNNDSKPDVVIAHHASNSLSTYEGNGDGTFVFRGTFPTGGVSPLVVILRDFNGDLFDDVAVTNHASASVGILLGAGDGTLFAASQRSCGVDPFDIEAVDINGDGNLDLIVSNGADGDVSVMFGDGGGGFASPVDFAAGANPRGLAVGDLNSDGRLDIAVANLDSSSDSVSILIGAASGTFQGPVSYAAGELPGDVTISDFDGDGDADIAVSNSTGISILVNSGNGTFLSPVDSGVPDGWIGLGSGDIDSDGKPDVLISTTARKIWIKKNTTTPFNRVFASGFESSN